MRAGTRRAKRARDRIMVLIGPSDLGAYAFASTSRVSASSAWSKSSSGPAEGSGVGALGQLARPARDCVRMCAEVKLDWNCPCPLRLADHPAGLCSAEPVRCSIPFARLVEGEELHCRVALQEPPDDIIQLRG